MSLSEILRVLRYSPRIVLATISRLWFACTAPPIDYKQITDGLVPIDGMWLVPTVAERWLKLIGKRGDPSSDQVKGAATLDECQGL